MSLLILWKGSVFLYIVPINDISNTSVSQALPEKEEVFCFALVKILLRVVNADCLQYCESGLASGWIQNFLSDPE